MLRALLSPFKVRATCRTTVFWLLRISAACRVSADEKTARLSRASAYSRRLKSITSWMEMLVSKRLDRTPAAMARRRADRPPVPCDGLFSSTVRSRTSGPPSYSERAIIGTCRLARSVEKGQKKAPRNLWGLKPAAELDKPAVRSNYKEFLHTVAKARFCQLVGLMRFRSAILSAMRRLISRSLLRLVSMKPRISS